MIPDLPPDASVHTPWGLWCVLAPSVFSALIWGLSTLFRPRPNFARVEEEPEDEPPDTVVEGPPEAPPPP